MTSWGHDPDDHDDPYGPDYHDNPDYLDDSDGPKKIMDWRGHSGTTLSSSFVFLLFLLSCRDFIRMILTPMLGRVRISVHHSHLMKLNIAFND